MTDALKAPFPWFGGKSQCAPEVWFALGDVDNYVEPFAGSLAVLLARPHAPKTETVNDLDHYIVNFWRALQHDPQAVAHYANNPVNECCPSGTIIATPGGGKFIEDIVSGDIVLGEYNGHIIETVVQAKTESRAREFVALGDLLLTENHPVCTLRGYIPAGLIAESDTIMRFHYPVDKDGFVLYNAVNGQRMGNLRTCRSENIGNALCRDNIQAPTSLLRASFAGTRRRKNTSRLLDNSTSAYRIKAGLYSIGEWVGRRMARPREVLDRTISKRSLNKSNRWRGRSSGACGICGDTEQALVCEKGEALQGGTKKRHAWETSYRRGKRENTFVQYGSPSYPRGKGQGIRSAQRKTVIGGTSGKIIASAQGEDIVRRTQTQNCRIHNRKKTSFMYRNIDSVSINNSRSNSYAGKRILNLSISPYRMQVQRISLQASVVVYNFQTTTGNYFANGILVHNCDLTARHLWLVNTGRERIARLLGDPEYYDVQVAGWWVWGICCWIGSGWCAGDGPWGALDGKLVNLRDGDDPGQGVNRKRIHLGNAGQGVNRQRIYLANAGVGVNRKRVHLADAGRGVNRQRVHLADAGRGVKTGEAEIMAYLDALAARLRYVRVCCGDWQRVVTPGALAHGGTVGVFLDPPYDTDIRDGRCYNTDAANGHISADVRTWCIANQDNPRYRIVLAGYAEEHELPGWRTVTWTAGRAYGTANSVTANSVNRTQETLWLSPHCLGDTVNLIQGGFEL